MDIQEKLIEIFQSRMAGPFLFLGSGFSRRYLGLEDWRGLLQRFCVTGKPFEYYLASANGHYPTVAALLAKDFNEYWWEAPEYEKSVERYKSKVGDETSALRIEISNYLSTLDQSKAMDSEYKNEVELLSGLMLMVLSPQTGTCLLSSFFQNIEHILGRKSCCFLIRKKLERYTKSMVAQPHHHPWL